MGTFQQQGSKWVYSNNRDQNEHNPTTGIKLGTFQQQGSNGYIPTAGDQNGYFILQQQEIENDTLQHHGIKRYILQQWGVYCRYL